MFALGFIILAVGFYLVDSAAKDRAPIQTLIELAKNPAGIRETLDASHGTAGLSNPTPVGGYRGTTVVPGYGAGTTGTVPADGVVGKVIAYATAQLGKPYRWGKAGPNSFDCSGLIYAAYRSAGVTIPRTTAAQLLSGTRVAKRNLQPGDLIFPYPGHVFLYVGGGRCIEAPHTGTTVHYTNIYQFMTARRFV